MNKKSKLTIFSFEVQSAPPVTWYRPPERDPLVRPPARGRHLIFTVRLTILREGGREGGRNTKGTKFVSTQLLDLDLDPAPAELGHLHQFDKMSGNSPRLYPCLPGSVNCNYISVSIPEYLVLLYDRSDNEGDRLGARRVRNITRVNNAVIIEIISCIYIEILREFD